MIGMIDSFRNQYSFLSNFHRHGGQLTAEHIYQAMKTDNPFQQIVVLSAETPSEAKELGQLVTLREDWDQVKVDIMLRILQCKFRNGSMEADLLLDTGDLELVEGNTWNDTFWGVCRGNGENWLGKLLMKVRSELQKN